MFILLFVEVDTEDDSVTCCMLVRMMYKIEIQ
jgi:hypothetical protein